MKGWAAVVCCAGLLFCGCGAKAVVEDMEVSEAVRVACVGDSITQGFGGHSYVEVLAAEATDAVYGNFGVCGQRRYKMGHQAMLIHKPMPKVWHGAPMWWCSCWAPMIRHIGKEHRSLKQTMGSWWTAISKVAHR